MDDITQRALDGTLDHEALTPAQRTRLADAERVIAAVVATVPNEPIPDLGPAVLAAIAARSGQAAAASPARDGGSWLAWLWRPQPISLRWRPAYAVGALAALVVAVMTITSPDTVPGTDTAVMTRFELTAPEAHRVTLAGGFTDWQPDIELTQGGSGIWTVVVPLEPGIHSYAFVIDGERWVPDPASPAYDDGFGGLNSRLALLPPDGVLQ